MGEDTDGGITSQHLRPSARPGNQPSRCDAGSQPCPLTPSRRHHRTQRHVPPRKADAKGRRRQFQITQFWPSQGTEHQGSGGRAYRGGRQWWSLGSSYKRCHSAPWTRHRPYPRQRLGYRRRRHRPRHLGKIRLAEPCLIGAPLLSILPLLPLCGEDFLYDHQGHAFGAPGRPGLAEFRRGNASASRHCARRRGDQPELGSGGQLADSGQRPAAPCRAEALRARRRRQGSRPAPAGRQYPPQRIPGDREPQELTGPSSSRRAFSRRAKITGKVVCPRFAAGAPPCL